MLVSEIMKLMTHIIDWDIENDVPIRGAFLDSRLVKKGSLFFAVRGECVDGNSFAQRAIDAGAAAVVMSDKNIYQNIKGNKILVEDVIDFMKELGTLRFAMAKAFKLAVTGSFGKTGTKEMLRLVFASSFSVYNTEGNKNNILGVTLTGSGIDESDVMVLELGTSSSGEIAVLSKMVTPDIAIVTSVGHAHIGRFSGIEGIISEKMSIVQGLKNGGTLIVPVSLKRYVPTGDYSVCYFGEGGDISINSVKHHGFYITYKVSGSDITYRINHPYTHVAESTLPVIAAARMKGIDDEITAKAISEYQPAKGHGNVMVVNDLMIIDDTYNAGFESIIRAAESLNEISAGPKFAVFGEMGEIEGYEEEFYNKIGTLSEKYHNINFYLIGSFYKNIPSAVNCHIFTERATALEAVRDIKSGVVVVKASNSKRFGEFVEVIKNSAERHNAL